jgi:hypothetical protein
MLARNDGIDPRPLIYGLAPAKNVTRHSKREGSAVEITTIGIDLAKSVFAVSGADRQGRVVLRRQLRRAQLMRFLGTLGLELPRFGGRCWAWLVQWFSCTALALV